MTLEHLPYFGVDGETGLPDAVSAWPTAPGRPPEPRDTAFDADRSDLSQVGWGIIHAEEDGSRVLEALRPLLDLRREQAGVLYRQTFHAGESVDQFRRYSRIAPGPADPARMPYYLLIVGGPDRIPYELQFSLDVQRAVGRVVFDDPADYRRYAQSVVAGEHPAPCRAPGLSIFAVRNANDSLTHSSVEQFARPLETTLTQHCDWPIRTILGQDATKQSLRKTLDPGNGPLVFTASHAVRFRAGHPRQLSDQGALVTADWPGPKAWRGPMPADYLWAATDLDPAADYSGLVAFSFGCYTAGTPHRNLFARPDQSPSVLAPKPFVSALSRALLRHPGGPARAVVGHVDQTFEGTFLWPGAGSRVDTFASALVALTRGARLGAALEVFARRYLEISALITERQWASPSPENQPSQELAALWQAYHDARGFSIVGDPAVRLTVP